MKVFLKADVEGATGVVSYEQAHTGGAEYEFGRKMLMSDLNAVLSGVFAADCDEAVVYDMHCEGRNINLEALDHRAVAICGKPTFHRDFAFGLDKSFDALLLVGFHSKAGTPNALLPHTYEEDVAEIRINDRSVGEIGVEAALAGEFGVPLVFLCGDSAGVQEAKALLGKELRTVAVKESITRHGGRCLPPSRTRPLLKETALKAARRAAGRAPFVCQTPTELSVTFRDTGSAAKLEECPNVERKGDREVVVTGDRFLSAYKSYILAREERA